MPTDQRVGGGVHPDRPGEPELRIFPKYDDPELLKVGNPFLRPQLTDVYEVGYGRGWDGGSAGSAVYHRDISDSFLRILAPDASNPAYDIVNRIYENAGNSERAEVVFTFTDMLNDFAIQQDIQGQGFTALYQNFLETQVATVGLRMKF